MTVCGAMLALACGLAAMLPTRRAVADSETASPPSAAVNPRTAGRPDDRDGVLVRIDGRFAWVVTEGEGFGDHPLMQVDAGVQFGRARVGRPPAVALVVGGSVGVGEALGKSNISWRVVGGIELPVAVSMPALSASLVEIVPVLQAGYLKVVDEDKRKGFTLRASVGMRFLFDGTAFYLTFEPFSVVLLPPPPGGFNRRTSKVAIELGILKVGARF